MAVRISLALFLIWFLTGFAQNVYHLFILRILLGIFGGFNTFSISLVTQSCPQNKVAKVIGTLQAVQIFSAAVGPFFGGILARWIGIRHTFSDHFTDVPSQPASLHLSLRGQTYSFPWRNESSGSGQEQGQTGLKNLMRLPNFTFLAALVVLGHCDRS